MAAGLYDILTETLGKGHFAVVKLAKHCFTGKSIIFSPKPKCQPHWLHLRKNQLFFASAFLLFGI